MTKRVIPPVAETWEFDCDRCAASSIIPDTSMEVMQHYLGGVKDKVEKHLCGACTLDLLRWLDLTPG